MEEELIQKIKYLRDVQKLSFHQIQDKTGIPRKKSSRIYYGTWSQKRSKDSKLDPYRDLIIHWFKEHPSLKAIQVFDRLKERGVDLSYMRVAQYTRALRKKKQSVFWPMEFLPGEEGQVDWFFVRHPILGKLCGFALILSFSRYLYAHLFRRHSFEFFIEGHLMAFQVFKGHPRALRYDNLKSVVLKKDPLAYHPPFLDFARHYGFEIRLCNIASGNEKGRVERVIRTLRETFFNTADHHTSLDALNQSLHEWVQKRNHTVHRSTEKTPAELFDQEKLKPLPQRPWHNEVIHPPKRPTKTGLMIFDTNQYSIPDYLCGEPLILRTCVNQVRIYDLKDRCVATHPRSFDRAKTFLNPQHRSFNQLSQKALRDRIYSVIKNLDPVVDQFLLQNQGVGEDPFHSAYLVFKLLKSHSRLSLFSALREALRLKSPRWKFILSVLDSREPSQPEDVHPQNPQLLDIDYKPRSLEDYPHEHE